MGYEVSVKFFHFEYFSFKFKRSRMILSIQYEHPNLYVVVEKKGLNSDI